MRTIFIEDKKDKIILTLNGNKLSGYKFHPDNTVEPVDESVFKYFDFLKLSSNYTQLPNVDNYQVYLDNETNYKHYFYNGVEDYVMFYKNNGEDATVYVEENKDGKRESKVKKFLNKGANVLLAADLIAALVAGGCFLVNEARKNNDVTLSEVKYLINSSPLEQRIKDLLYNEEYYNVVLPEINKSQYTKELFRKTSTGLFIVYDEMDCGGYVIATHPNVIFINKNVRGTKDELDFILHEREHQKQVVFYGMFNEALSEIISYEFNIEAEMNAYPECVRLVKELMEIIGPKPLWHFNYSGEDDEIFEAVKPYLDEEELNDFVECIHFPNLYGTKEQIQEIVDRFSILLKKLAERKNVRFDDRFLDERIYFNNKDIHGLKIENEMHLWDVYNDGSINFYMYDEKGNFVGKPTYNDLITKFDPDFQRSIDETHYEIECNNEEDGWYGAYVRRTNGKRLTLVPLIKEADIMLPYDEYLEKYPEDIEKEVTHIDAFQKFYAETELQKNDTKQITYPDGSRIDILDNDTVIRTDKDGNKTTYEISGGSTLDVYNNNYVVWKAEDGFCYRVIFPNGVMLEKYITHRDVKNAGDRTFKYVLSTGDTFDVLESFYNDIRAYTTKDGKYRISLDGVAYIDQLDENGNKVGVMRFDSDYVRFLDNEGKISCVAGFGNTVYCDNNNYQEDESYDAFNKYGIITHYDKYENVLGLTYPNGYSVDFDVNVNIYNPNKELVKTLEWSRLDYYYSEDGTISIYTNNRNYTLYFGKYLVERDDDGKPLSVTNFDNIMDDSKEHNM